MNQEIDQYPPEPIPKALYEELRKAGVGSFEVKLTACGDEGLVEVALYDEGGLYIFPNGEPGCPEFEVSDWADEAFNFSGSGSDYGDVYHYDLMSGIVRHDSWHMETSVQPQGPSAVRVSDGDTEEELPHEPFSRHAVRSAEDVVEEWLDGEGPATSGGLFSALKEAGYSLVYNPAGYA